MRRRKASDEEIESSYAETRNIWKTADTLGMCGQSVWERLNKLGIKLNHRPLSEQEKDQIRSVYRMGVQRGDGSLRLLSESIGRTIPFISRFARTEGLTSYNRSASPQHLTVMSAITKERWGRVPHPRGMLGKKHTQATLDRISEASKESNAKMTPDQKESKLMKMLHTKCLNGTLLQPRKASWKSGWRDIGGKHIYARSRWEANYARYLELLKIGKAIKEWEHEPETFWFEKIKTGTRCYIPDFRVTNNDGSIEYHEVKGWMDSRSKTKLNRMRIYHPTVKMILRDSSWYKSNQRNLSKIVPGWE